MHVQSEEHLLGVAVKDIEWARLSIDLGTDRKLYPMVLGQLFVANILLE